MNAQTGPRWRRLYQRPGRGIPLNVSGPDQPAGVMAKRGLAQLLGLALTVLAVVEYRTGHGPVTVAWLAIGPLLASLVLRPRTTAMVAPFGCPPDEARASACSNAGSWGAPNQ